jgi:hypothetical protein
MYRKDEEGDFLMMSMILNGALLYNIANCLQQRFAIAILPPKSSPQVQILYCGVRGYLLYPLLHTPHSLTLYSALIKIVLPYRDNDNIF